MAQGARIVLLDGPPSAEPTRPMIAIDCPLCTGQATADEALTAVTCDGCGVTVGVAADPAPLTLDVAA